MGNLIILAITDDRKASSLVEALQPWHEFEATHEDDQYVIEVDESENITRDFDGLTTTALIGPEGSLFNPFDRMFWEETPDGASYRNFGTSTQKGHFIEPEHLAKISVPYSDLFDKAHFACGYLDVPKLRLGSKPKLRGKHKFGYVLVDQDGHFIKAVRRTNPNARWAEWYEPAIGVNLILKQKRTATRGRIRNLDLEAMSTRARAERAGLIEKLASGCDMDISTTKIAVADLNKALSNRARGTNLTDYLATFGSRILKVYHEVTRHNMMLPPLKGRTVDEWIADAPTLGDFVGVVVDGAWHDSPWMTTYSSGLDHDEWAAAMTKRIQEMPDRYLNLVCVKD